MTLEYIEEPVFPIQAMVEALRQSTQPLCILGVFPALAFIVLYG